MSQIRIENLTHIFPNGTIAIEDINLEIKKGEFIILTGKNGSGKTVFMRHLNGLLSPTKGEILLNGDSIYNDLVKTRQAIGLLFQDPDNQIIGQTILEDVSFGPENLLLAEKEINLRVKHAIESVGISTLTNKNSRLLSGGEKRKLTIAGILAMHPEVIIFDEPFSGLDYPGVLKILKNIIKLHKSGHTIIVITHDIEKMLAHSERIIVMKNGKIGFDGTPESFLKTKDDFEIKKPPDDIPLECITWL